MSTSNSTDDFESWVVSGNDLIQLANTEQKMSIQVPELEIKCNIQKRSNVIEWLLHFNPIVTCLTVGCVLQQLN